MKNINESKKRSKMAFLALMAVLVFSISIVPLISLAAGSNMMWNDIMTLEKGETIDGPGFFAGDRIRIDGNVNGITLAFGQEVRVDGNIKGDLFVAAQNIYINGTVTGNIYTAGQSLSVGTKATGDVFAAGQYLVIEKKAVIGRDLFTAGSTVRQDGTVGRNMFGGAQEIIMNGPVGNDVKLQTNSLKLMETASIKGNLEYEGSNQAYIAPGAKVGGATDWKYVDPRAAEQAMRKVETPASIIGHLIWSVLGALLIWFVVKVWRPEFWPKTAGPLSEQPLKSLGAGLLALIVIPIVIIIAMITVIGIPLGFLMAIAYGVSLYLSKIVVAVFIGSWLAKRFNWPELHRGVWLVLLGLLIVGIVTIPDFIGPLIGFIVLIAGLGSLVLSHYKAKEAAE